MKNQNPIEILHLLKGESKKSYNVQDVMSRGITSEHGLSQGVIASLLIVYGHLELAKALVDTGVVPERGPKNLHFGKGNTHRLSLLSMMLSKPTFYCEYQNTSFWKRIDYILKHKDIWPVGLNEICEFSQATPLMQVDSAYYKQYTHHRHRLMRLLVDAGADINLHTATGSVTQSASYSQKDNGERAIEEELQFLYELGFDKTIDPHITLSGAIAHDRWHHKNGEDETESLAQAFLNAGFELTAPTDCPRKVNPFCRAIEHKLPHWITRLLDAGLDPAHIDPDTGNTIFSEAATGTKYSMKSLSLIPNEKLKHLANHKNKKGETPLHQAVASLSLPLVQKLIACGADPNALNAKNQLPIQTVKCTNLKAKQKLDAIIEFLDQSGSELSAHKIPSVFNQACRTLASDLIIKLIKQGADVNGVDETGMTPLLALAQYSKMYYNEKLRQEATQSYDATLDALLAAGADFNARDKHGNTALHYAVKNRSAVMVEALLRCGFDTNALNKNNLAAAHMWHSADPLTKSLTSQDKNALDIVKAFTAHGFNPTLKGPGGEEAFADFHDTDVFKSALTQWDLGQSTQPTATGASRRARL